MRLGKRDSELNHKCSVWRRMVWQEFTYFQKNPLSLSSGWRDSPSKQQAEWDWNIFAFMIRSFLISLLLCLMLVCLILWPWRWRQYLSPKLKYLSTRLAWHHTADDSRHTLHQDTFISTSKDNINSHIFCRCEIHGGHVIRDYLCWSVCINFSKPSVYSMHMQNTAFCPHSVFLCYLWFSQ
jgi:hypothetical protein